MADADTIEAIRQDFAFIHAWFDSLEATVRVGFEAVGRIEGRLDEIIVRVERIEDTVRRIFGGTDGTRGT
jgi:hypothetical protein